MPKTFIMVTATYMHQNSTSNLNKEGRGIIRLKRGHTVEDFIRSFLEERGITEYTATERVPGLWHCLPQADIRLHERTIMSFFFHVISEQELGHYAKRLKPAELERDIKKLNLAIQP